MNDAEKQKDTTELQEFNKLQEAIIKGTEAKLRGEQLKIEEETITKFLTTLVGTQMDVGDGEKINKFIAELHLTKEEMEYLMSEVTESEDPRRKALHSRLSALKESTGEKPENETVQKIEEFKQGMFELLPESAKKHEQILETMINGLIANIAEAIAEGMKGFGVDGAEAYEIGLAFRLKEIRKTSEKNHTKENKNLSKEKIEELVKTDVANYEEGYRKWMKTDVATRSKNPPMTLDAANLVLNPKKIDEKKEEITKTEIKDKEEPKTYQLEDKKTNLSIVRSGNDLKVKKGTEKEGIIKLDEFKSVSIEESKKDGKTETSLVIKDNGTEYTMTNEDLAIALKEQKSKVTFKKKEGNESKEFEITFPA